MEQNEKLSMKTIVLEVMYGWTKDEMPELG